MSASILAERIAALDWDALGDQLDRDGYALTRSLLSGAECEALTGLFDRDECFRGTVDMARLRFGAGRYRYFDRPPPAPVAALREHLYPPLAGLANAWAERLRLPERYPERLDDFLARCHAAGQRRPTPILFRYRQGDHNALHQDLYGEVAFPFQAVTVLSPPDRYRGGEFVLCTQRPRAQSLVEVIQPGQGEMLIFPNRHRPAWNRASGRYYRTTVRHGVSRLHSGERYSLGIIFHDAR